MNIFILSENPVQAAQLQCDKHVVKMILETTQILSTVMNQKGEMGPYPSTHVNHPCVKWAGESYWNFMWLLVHGRALCDEYTLRYGKVHKCEALLDEIYMLHLPHLFDKQEMTPFVKAMPDYLKSIEDPVEAYRTYYQRHKAKIAKYTVRKVPDFMVDYVEGNQTVDSGS